MSEKITKIGRVLTWKIFTKAFWVGNANVHPNCFECNDSYCGDHKTKAVDCPIFKKIEKNREEGILTLEKLQAIERLQEEGMM